MTVIDFPDHDVPELNHSSFAYGVTAAMASYLDAVTEVGGLRKVRITEARGHILGALKNTDTPEEIAMARGILDQLDLMVGRGQNF